RCSPGAPRWNVLGRSDGSRLAADLDREVPSLKTRDRFPVLVEHRRFDEDEIDAGSERLRRQLLRERHDSRRQDEYGCKNARQLSLHVRATILAQPASVATTGTTGTTATKDGLSGATIRAD